MLCLDFADPLVSGPITLTLAQGTLEVTAEQLAAATTIVQVKEIVELGALNPEHIITPGIFVQRVVAVGGNK